VYPAELEKWRASCHRAWPNRGGACQPAGHTSRPQRIKELERALLRKDRALAETAALLVLS